MKVSQTFGDQTKISTASAIDLAGSEDNRRTDNGKERLVESANINKSLFVLAQCVEAISKKQTRIPYRESKMTRILSLGQNNGFTVMILNLAPIRSYHLDTLSSLNFANRTKKIEVNEIENEPVFNNAAKQASSILGSSIQQRQPLRPLVVSHNIQPTRADKPIKAFSVYSDKGRSNRPSSALANSGRKVETSKRTLSETSNSLAQTRPGKAIRPSNMSRPPVPSSQTLSQANIEAIIDRRIEEQLAAQKSQNPGNAAKHMDEELQRRLEKLERRIEEKEEKDDPKAEGLQYLLMAKQHVAVGHDQSALRMYQLALPFFPGNRKLEHKLRKLEDKIQARRAAQINPETSASIPTHPTQPTSPCKTTVIPKPTKHTAYHESDGDEYEEAQKPSEDSSDSDSSARRRHKARKPISKPKLPIYRDLQSSSVASDVIADRQDGLMSPRTSALLQIINTRDLKLIRSLKGVGAKRAAVIVDALGEMDGEIRFDEQIHASEITSLEQLGQLKGVGRSTVEGMRMGLAV